VEVVRTILAPNDKGPEVLKSETGEKNNLVSFKQWLKENASGTGTHTSRKEFDSGLSDDAGLAYRPPVMPKDKSEKAKRIEKLFKGSKAKLD
jgi:hypothetical protein